VRVALGDRSYQIHIGPGLFDRADAFIQSLGLGRQGVIITDSNVGPLYAARLQAALARGGMTTSVLTVPAGEVSKSFRQVERLIKRFPLLKLDRGSAVFALGGGVVGDLAGFVSAIYLRGLPFVQVPTSLLAQVDSSVGGKTGVNLPQGKNLVGAFHQPVLVLADTTTLRTLPGIELRAGFAEVLKHGAIYDARFFGWLESNYRKVLKLDPVAVAYAVKRCCEIKADVVSQDERESGLRAILNFGHTIGHAMEALADYEGLLHGEAISMGMCCAAWLSVRHAGLKQADAKRIENLIVKSGLPARIGDRVDMVQLGRAMRLDKKARAGKLRFVLLSRLGKAAVSDAVTDVDIEEAVNVFR
jgi:3-dehydroquinate synthase